MNKYEEFSVITSSEEETIALGEKLGRQVPPNTVIALDAPLGSGKTYFIRALHLGLVSRKI